jgi:hypothetical protein
MNQWDSLFGNGRFLDTIFALGRNGIVKGDMLWKYTDTLSDEIGQRMQFVAVNNVPFSISLDESDFSKSRDITLVRVHTYLFLLFVMSFFYQKSRGTT